MDTNGLMKEIVICKHCGCKEYYGKMTHLNGWRCRPCYIAEWELQNKQIYKWNDKSGQFPN
jgi:hypothetical protein